jgi:hypothetical protein
MQCGKIQGFFDDFIGSSVEADRYVIDDTDGTVGLMTGDFGNLDGILGLQAGPDAGDLVSIRTVAKVFHKDQPARMRARMRLSSTQDIALLLGFYSDANNYVGLRVDTGTDHTWHLEANKAGTPSDDDSGIHIDMVWHTVELRLLGSSLGAELVFDGDETNKLTLSSSALPEGPFYMFCSSEMLTTFTGQTRDVIIDWVHIQQEQASSFVQKITGPGGNDEISAMCQFNGLLHVGRGSGTGDSKARYVQRLNRDKTWTDLGAPSGTASAVSEVRNFDGSLFAGHDDENVIYKWSSGTTWASAGTLTGATGCACLVRFLGTVSEQLFVGTIGNPAKVMVWNGTTTWTDISSPSWPSGAAAIMLVVHNGKLYAYHGGNGKVYQYVSGTTWTDLGAPGGTSATTTQSRHLADFYDELYAYDTVNNSLYRYNSPSNWGFIGVFSATFSVRTVLCDDMMLFLSSSIDAVWRYTPADGVFRTAGQATGANSPRQIGVGDGMIFVGDDSGDLWIVR